MEEPTFLIAMHRVVGGIHIQYYLRRRSSLDIQKQIDQQRVDQSAIGDYLLVATTLRRCRIPQLQAIQRARAGQGVPAVTLALAVLAGQIGTTCRPRHRAVGAQSVMVVDVLVAERRERRTRGCFLSDQ